MLFGSLTRMSIDFFTGVPDSLLKDFSAYLVDHVEKNNHIIAANEGAAIALAAGTYLATGRPALVYMQNSGIGNATNPLLSLADPEVYSIPMILLIGWRGMPGLKDEPQHIKQGRIQNTLLGAMEIPYRVIGPDDSKIDTIIQDLLATALQRSGPVALVIQKKTFSTYTSQMNVQCEFSMSREEALRHVIEALDDDDLIVSTTGMTSREVFEIRARSGLGHHRDFLTVGSMGHCSQIALGVAFKKPDRNVYCLDGDGSFIMHMGSVAVIGQTAPANLKHIVINNTAHDSVGGLPTAASVCDLSGVARACGYTATRMVDNETDLIEGLQWLKQERGPTLLEIRVKVGARKDLGRPTRTPLENRMDFEENLRSTE